MRVLYLLFLVVIVGAVAVFAYQNDGDATLRFLDRSLTAPLSVTIGVVYVLGMLSGWSVVGLLRRSLERVTEHRAR